MVHFSMSAHLFGRNHQISILTPSTSPTKQIPCALPKLEYLHLVDSKPLAHSLKKHRGILPSFPFRNSWHRHACLCAFLVHLNLNDIARSASSECGASVPPFTYDNAPPIPIPRDAAANRYAHSRTPSISNSRPIHSIARSSSDTPDSSLTSPDLLRIYQC